jgi:alanine dehydrogenase
VAPRLLTDDDVRSRLTPAVAVAAARRALIDASLGSLVAPPRRQAEIGDLDLVLTIGGYPDGIAGFRAYGTWSGESDQAVLVWSAAGELLCVVVGSELGPRRTGALGAAAAGALARPGPAAVAVVGSGQQAWTQLWALTAAAEIREVRVFSPTAAHRSAFADRADTDLGLQALAVDSAETAVRDADIVILATRSPTPVIDAAWVAPGAHVTTVGPKRASAHETPPELADLAALVVSDSPGQAASYGEPFFTSRPLIHVGAVLDGRSPGRRSDGDITLYCSTGLAGSEVVMAAALLT